MLDSTVKGVDANSYVSLNEAVNYFNSRPYGLTFNEEDNFDAFLIHATNIIDRYVEWFGDKTTEEQRLEWPRTGTIAEDDDDIPFDIKMATFELAFTIEDTNVLSSSSIGNFESIKVSTIQLKINTASSGGLIPRHILPLLERYGYTSGINCTLLRQ